jgi:homoserine dehydrogenase
MTRPVPSVPSARPGQAGPALSPVQASHPARSTATSSDAFHSSGQSPGANAPSSPAQKPSPAQPPLRTLHLLGPGRVGRAFLQQLAGLPVRVVAISDAGATVFDRQGLPLAAIAAHKAAGGSLASWPRAESIPTELAVRIVGADIVVDATPTDQATAPAALQRARAALQNGAFLAVCGKNALAEAASEWLLSVHRGRVGVHAALGGSGQALVRELPELREHCRSLALVGNVSTTVLIEAIERGLSLAEGIAEAQQRGLLEADPTQDLDGSDAATKLRAVWGAVFGDSWTAPPAFERIARADVRGLDPELLRERAARGATTRLVARGSRRGDDLRVAYEEVPRGSPLAAPPDRVVYGYELPGGLRVHTGLAIGHERTAGALLADVAAFLATPAVEVRR